MADPVSVALLATSVIAELMKDVDLANAGELTDEEYQARWNPVVEAARKASDNWRALRATVQV